MTHFHPDAATAPLLAFAHELADLSAAAIRPHFRRLAAVENKLGPAGFDPVTVADRAAEEAIRRAILTRYPDHEIVGEEFGTSGRSADYRWIIDPIDGTRSFMMGLHSWGTLIGLTRDNAPVLGLMNQPFTGERFWADGDAAHYRAPDGGLAPIRTRACPLLEEAVLAATHPDIFRAGVEWERFQAVKDRARMTRYGGDCFAYCLLAMGQIDLVIEAGLNTYDIAALVPIIERAGGVVTTWDGAPATPGGRIVAAGDPSLHAVALRLLGG